MKFNITSDFREAENRPKLYNWRGVVTAGKATSKFCLGLGRGILGSQYVCRHQVGFFPLNYQLLILSFLPSLPSCGWAWGGRVNCIRVAPLGKREEPAETWKVMVTG